MRHYISTALFVLLALSGVSQHAWAAKIGSQFRANTFIGSQQEPSVAGLSGGGYVVTWTSEGGQDGSFDGVYGQRYSAVGVKVGIEFRVNTYTTSYQSDPSVTGLNNGGFVVTWFSQGQDGSFSGVYGQRYNATGAPVGNEFRVNFVKLNNQNYPAVTSRGNGGFVVAWSSYGQDGDEGGIYGQRYTNTGARAGTEFRVNTTTVSDQDRPSIARLSDGGFVVTWTSNGQDGDQGGIYGQRYDNGGAPAGAEFRVNTRTVDQQDRTSVAGLNNGGFVVTWRSYGQDGSGSGVYGQRYNAAGAKDGANFRVNTFTESFQATPSVASLSDGGFVVAWESDGQDGSGYGVYGQRYSAAGARSGGEFSINNQTANDQIEPSVARFGTGNFVVIWRLNGVRSGIYGQRFGP